VDESTIDNAFDQLQQESKDLARSLQKLAGKLQLAISQGDTAARDWLLDLKEIAVGVRAEQVQADALLNAIHSYITDVHTSQTQPQYRQTGVGGTGGGMGGLLGSRFGRAIETGAGFAVGEDLINRIF
jgi:hypothetical protein